MYQSTYRTWHCFTLALCSLVGSLNWRQYRRIERYIPREREHGSFAKRHIIRSLLCNLSGFAVAEQYGVGVNQEKRCQNFGRPYRSCCKIRSLITVRL